MCDREPRRHFYVSRQRVYNGLQPHLEMQLGKTLKQRALRQRPQNAVRLSLLIPRRPYGIVQRTNSRQSQSGTALDLATCVASGLARSLAAAAALTLAVLTVIAIILPLHQAQANGAATIVFDQTGGSYRLVVGIIPARPVIPRTHLTIQVFDAASQQPLRDTDVDLLIAATGPPGASDFGPQQVMNEQTLRYFEVDVPFSVIGPWQVSVTISSQRGAAEFVMNLMVGEPGAQIQWIWIAALMAAIIAVGIWTWLTLQRRRG